MHIPTPEESLRKYDIAIDFLAKHHRRISDEKFMEFSEMAFAFGQEAGKSFLEVFEEIQELLFADVIPESDSDKAEADKGEIQSADMEVSKAIKKHSPQPTKVTRVSIQIQTESRI